MPGLVTRGLGMKLQITVTGGGGGTGTGNLQSGPAIDLLDAVRLFIQGDPTLAAALPGGLYTDGAGAKTTGTYLIVEEKSAWLEWRSDVSEVLDTRVVFKVYDPDLDQAGTVGDQLYSAFKGRTLSWTSGTAGRFVPRDRKQFLGRGHAKGAGGYEFYYLLEFQTRIRRSL